MAIVDTTKHCETNLKPGVSFSFSEDSSKLFSMLSSYLYSDKEYCVLSELSSNAVDAHRMVGKESVPIYIDLPTALDHSLTVRDYGPGLSEADIYVFLTQYGKSSKGGSNKDIGTWGIGSKSPAAITDTWSIKSYHAGEMKHYEVYIDGNGIPTLTKVFERETDESGLEIIIPVSEQNINQWRETARKAFQWYPVKPLLNVEVSYEDIIQNNDYFSDNWYLASYPGRRHSSISPIIITTFREYSLVLSSIWAKLDPKLQYLAKLPLVIKFDIGEIDLSISREQLQLNEKSINAITARLAQIDQDLTGILTKQMHGIDTEIEFKIKAIKVMSELPYVLKEYFFSRHIKNKFGVTVGSDLDWISFKLPDIDSVSLKLFKDDKFKTIKPNWGMYYKNNEVTISILEHNTGCSLNFYITAIHKLCVVNKRGVNSAKQRIKNSDNDLVLLIDGDLGITLPSAIKQIDASSLDHIKSVRVHQKYIKNLYRIYGKKLVPVLTTHTFDSKDVLIELQNRAYSKNAAINHGISKYLIESNRNVYGYLVDKDKPDVNITLGAVAVKKEYDDLLISKEYTAVVDDLKLQRKLDLFDNSSDWKSVLTLLCLRDTRFKNIKEMFKDQLLEFEKYYKVHENIPSSKYYSYNYKVSNILSQQNNFELLLDEKTIDSDVIELNTIFSDLETRYPMLSLINNTESTVVDMAVNYINTIDYIKGEVK